MICDTDNKQESNKKYPPSGAIPSQLATIRAVAQMAINMFEETEDPETIQTNLDMIQTAIDYLRGAELSPQEPEKPKVSFELIHPKDIDCSIDTDDNHIFEVSIIGLDATPEIRNPELFGDIQNVSEITLNLPVICGKSYTVTQENKLLEYYKDDPSISQDSEGIWIKNNTYYTKRDMLEYSFLVGEGRNIIHINIFDEGEEEVLCYLNIVTHIHFKEEVIEDDKN